MTRIYQSPPVAEAVCDFRFADSQPWDLTIPGLLYERIRSDFPAIEQATVLQVALDPAGNQVAQQAQPSVRFYTADRTGIVQVAPSLLSIHQVRPYRTWEHFKDRILGNLSVYCDVAKSEALGRVGLRYLNRIELPGPLNELNDYFQVVPQVPEPVPQVFESFLAQIQIPYGSPASRLRLAFGTVGPETPGHQAFVLDLEMFTLDNAVPGMDDVPSWLETAHARIEEAFESAFTEKTHKEVFGEVEA